MNAKRIISMLLSFIMMIICIPNAALAEEYYILEDIASENGYEYFYYSDTNSANLRSSSYILAFQADNGLAGYKTVLGDIGIIELNNNVDIYNGKLAVSKTDLQTKLIKYFPNLPDSSYMSQASNITNGTTNSSPSLSVPSDWARAEVERAANNALITDKVRQDYQAYITREQFCELVIKLHDKLSGRIASAGVNKFVDTSNTEVAKAYSLGIVNGISDTEFAPYNLITRQEICTMLVRAIGVIYPNLNTGEYQSHTFDDGASIAEWAYPSVQFAYDNNIMRGIGANLIDPLGNTTCEQAILLINRIYENRSRLSQKNAEDVMETLNQLDFGDDDELNSVSVSFSDDDDSLSASIRKIASSDLIYSTTGIKGSAVNITCQDDFEKATITFDYKPDRLGETSPSDLAVAWFNTDLNRIEVLDSKVNTSEHTVSVETTHFSEYVLVDSKEWYSVWQRGQTVVRETDANGNYLENFNVQLVVDCSGSMSGDRIETARQCTYDFIQKLSGDDRFSVIQFADDANTIIPTTEVRNADMDSVRNAVMNMNDGGGTDFNEALRECINQLDFNDRSYTNIIVFLSDGESTVNDSILETLSENGVRIASVALGSTANTSTMKRLSDNTNGQYVYAEDSSDLDVIYNAIQGSLIGVDATDTDGDGIPNIIETTGMKNQYGNIIRTDPNKADTDGDGKTDAEEMGKLIETDVVTEMDRQNGITKNVYFEMVSDPVEGHYVSETAEDKIELIMQETYSIVEGQEGAVSVTLKINGIAVTDVEGVIFISSSDDSVIQVTEQAQSGTGAGTVLAYVTAIDKGDATITAYYRGQRASCNVTVKDDGLVDGLAVSATYREDSYNTGIFAVTVENGANDTWIVDLSGQTPTEIIDNTARDVIITFDTDTFEPINGGYTVEIDHIFTNDKETITYPVRVKNTSGLHNVTITAEAEGFEPATVTEIVTISDSISDLKNSVGEYVKALYELSSDDISGPEDGLKEAAYETVRNINFDVYALTNLPDSTSERNALKECFYMAIFDMYMYYLYNDGGLLNKPYRDYFDNITVADFADGGIAAATKIVKDTKEFIENLVPDDKHFSNEYEFDGYSYIVELNVDGVMSGGEYEVTITSKDSGKEHYSRQATGINNLDSVENAMINYLKELSVLYEKANRCAFKTAITEVLQCLPSLDELFTDANMTHLNGAKFTDNWFKKLDDKVINALKECGLADINEFLGDCITAYDTIRNYTDLVQLLQSGNSDAIEEVCNDTKKCMDSMEKYINEASNGWNASTIALKELQNKIKESLEKISGACADYMAEHEDEFDSWWPF